MAEAPTDGGPWRGPSTEEWLARFVPCPVRSSITDQPCLLPEGHESDSPFRFHRFARKPPVGWTRPGVGSVPGLVGDRAVILEGLRIYRSVAVKRGEFALLGAPAKRPENWRSMTRDEQLRWAARNATAVVFHPLDEVPRGR